MKKLLWGTAFALLLVNIGIGFYAIQQNQITEHQNTMNFYKSALKVKKVA